MGKDNPKESVTAALTKAPFDKEAELGKHTGIKLPANTTAPRELPLDDLMPSEPGRDEEDMTEHEKKIKEGRKEAIEENKILKESIPSKILPGPGRHTLTRRPPDANSFLETSRDTLTRRPPDANSFLETSRDTLIERPDYLDEITQNNNNPNPPQRQVSKESVTAALTKALFQNAPDWGKHAKIELPANTTAPRELPLDDLMSSEPGRYEEDMTEHEKKIKKRREEAIAENKKLKESIPSKILPGPGRHTLTRRPPDANSFLETSRDTLTERPADANPFPETSRDTLIERPDYLDEITQNNNNPNPPQRQVSKESVTAALTKALFQNAPDWGKHEKIELPDITVPEFDKQRQEALAERRQARQASKQPQVPADMAPSSKNNDDSVKNFASMMKNSFQSARKAVAQPYKDLKKYMGIGNTQTGGRQ